MEEYLDILDKTGKPLGESYLKSVVHQKGYYHNTVHIWFYTKEGQILLAQRSFKKTICPGMWDVSVAGHMEAGETLEAAAVREIREEIGTRIPLVSTPLSAYAAGWNLNRRIDALRIVEAIRSFAATHDGRLPSSLEEIQDTPIPSDLYTGRTFSYQSDNGEASLTAPSIAEIVGAEVPELPTDFGAINYRIRMRK